MHCVRFEMRLNQLLDSRVAPDSDLELLEHAAECPECGELLAGHELMLEAIGRLEAPSVGADFAVRVAAQIASNPQPTSRWASAPGFRRTWLWTIASVAAGLLIAVGLWRIFSGASAGDRQPLESISDNRIHPSTPSSIAPAEAPDPYHRLYSRTEELRRNSPARKWNGSIKWPTA